MDILRLSSTPEKSRIESIITNHLVFLQSHSSRGTIRLPIQPAEFFPTVQFLRLKVLATLILVPICRSQILAQSIAMRSVPFHEKQATTRTQGHSSTFVYDHKKKCNSAAKNFNSNKSSCFYHTKIIKNMLKSGFGAVRASELADKYKHVTSEVQKWTKFYPWSYLEKCHSFWMC